jgi:hypothetical protein
MIFKVYRFEKFLSVFIDLNDKVVDHILIKELLIFGE